MIKVLSLSFEKISAHLPCYLSKDTLNRDFLDNYLCRFSGVRKSKNTSNIRVIFFLKMFKIESKFRKCKKKIGKMFFVANVIASENVAINCLC